MIPKISRDSWLAIGLFVTVTVITAVAVIRQTQEAVQQPPLASFSAQPDGAKALAQWLVKIGYRVSDTSWTRFDIPSTAKLVLLLEPTTIIQENEWAEIDNWVEEGGTLLLTGSNVGSFTAFQHYDVSLRYLSIPTATLQTPLFTSPALPTAVPVNADAFLQTERTDLTVHLAGTEGHPLVISFEQEAGRVILSSTPHPFSNLGLQEAGNPELVLNLVNVVPLGELVWFDEWHHGIREVEAVGGGPGEWIREAPTGRALLFCGVVIFLSLVMRGRNFGRPVPLATDISRRTPLEYITAVANLSRRAGHRTAVLQDYHFRLKRELGHRYRLSPTLPDDEFITRLAEYNPNLDKKALQNLLTRLSQPKISESTLLQLAAETANWLKKS